MVKIPYRDRVSSFCRKEWGELALYGIGTSSVYLDIVDKDYPYWGYFAIFSILSGLGVRAYKMMRRD